MQAIPAMPVEQIGPGRPTGNGTAGEIPAGKPFSKHLTTARDNLGGQDYKKTGDSGKNIPETPTVNLPGEEPDKNRGVSLDMALFAANAINPANMPEQGLIANILKVESGDSANEQINTAQNLNQSGPGIVTTTTLLESLLKNNLNQESSQQVSSGFKEARKGFAVPQNVQTHSAVNSAPVATDGKGNNAQADLTIENWRAQFKYHGISTPQASNSEGMIKPLTGDKEGARPPVFAYTTAEMTDVVAPSHAKGNSALQLPQQRQDANSNFIHSNLPDGFTAKTGENGNKETQQQNSNGQGNMSREILSQVERNVTAKPQQDTPLVFSLPQDAISGAGLQHNESITSPILRLPSGTEVPHNQIVNQVLDRFTLNRTLESGTVTLKLHPQELGELRMEIKVEQDNIKAHITTQNPQVQEILDRHLPRLREALAQHGFNLEQMQVSVASDSNSDTQLFQEHFNRQQNTRSPRVNPDGIMFSLDEEPVEDEPRISANKQNLSVLI